MTKYLCDWQLDLFDQTPPTEIEDLRTFSVTLKASHENLRKGVFRRLDDLQKTLKTQNDHIFFLQATLKDLLKMIDSIPIPDPVNTNDKVNEKKKRFSIFADSIMVEQEEGVCETPDKKGNHKTLSI